MAITLLWEWLGEGLQQISSPSFTGLWDAAASLWNGNSQDLLSLNRADRVSASMGRGDFASRWTTTNFRCFCLSFMSLENQLVTILCVSTFIHSFINSKEILKIIIMQLRADGVLAPALFYTCFDFKISTRFLLTWIQNTVKADDHLFSPEESFESVEPILPQTHCQTHQMVLQRSSTTLQCLQTCSARLSSRS